MTGSDFNALPPPWLAMIIVFLIMPLGVWKLVEIIIWFCHHIHWG